MHIGIVHTASSPCRCAESIIRGLAALGHSHFLVDSEEIGVQAPALAAECDLVIDHTDTYQGRGMLRPLVRVLLEDCGARVVGTPARACFLADNKAAAKTRLAEAGILVPPGIAVPHKILELPGNLEPPLVVKPAFEHMSRGIRIAQTAQEACASADQLLEALKQPVLVESYIPGRELAVSLLEEPHGLRMLPVLDWGIEDYLTEAFKLRDATLEPHKVVQAGLSEDLYNELDMLAQRAFRVLGLRDYGRFDVRLTANGEFYFLEANTTPSFEPLEALAVSASWAGLEYPDLVQHILSAAHCRYQSRELPQAPPSRRHTQVVSPNSSLKELSVVSLDAGSIEIEIMEGVPSPPPSTIEFARLLDIRPGEEVLELGCGSGLLSIAAAGLGAARVVATDVDEHALQAAARNAVRNGAADRITICAGSWYEALQGNPSDRFDAIIATPPQTPGPHPFGPKYGGPDGAGHLLKIIEGAPRFLKPENGRLWILAISLANPLAVWKSLHERFSHVSLIRQTERPFAADEYDAWAPGLFSYLCSLRASGISEFTMYDNGACCFYNRFICASGPRP